MGRYQMIWLIIPQNTEICDSSEQLNYRLQKNLGGFRIIFISALCTWKLVHDSWNMLSGRELVMWHKSLPSQLSQTSDERKNRRSDKNQPYWHHLPPKATVPHYAQIKRFIFGSRRVTGCSLSCSTQHQIQYEE